MKKTIYIILPETLDDGGIGARIPWNPTHHFWTTYIFK